MITNTAEVRRMLRTYGRQLTSAKRLARFRRALRLAHAEDMVDISRQARRRELIERISREIIENLIVNGTENATVVEVLNQIERDYGQRIIFEYPLDGNDVQLIKETEQGPIEVTGEEKERIMQRLWEITLAKVDATML